MPRRLRRSVPILAGLAAVVFVFVARQHLPQAFERARNASFDALQRSAPRAASTAPVVVIDIDDETLHRYGRWPWPRTVLADLVRGLQDMGAGTVALDMNLSEADQTSPSVIAADWERSFGFHAADPGRPLPDYDRILADTFARGRVVTGVLLVEKGGTPPTFPVPIATVGRDPVATVTGFGGSVPNLAALDEAAAGHGSIAFRAEGDEIVRRVPLLMHVGPRLIPSLALETLRVMQDEDTIKVRAEQVDGTVTGFAVRVGAVDLHLDARGRYWIRHPAARSTRTVPAWRILDAAARDGVRPDVAGAAALVGTSALGLGDLRPTPMTPFEPGVDLHADVIEQATAGLSLDRPAWMPGAEVGAAVALGALTALVTAAARLRFAGLLVLTLPAAVGAVSVVAFDGAGLLVDPVLPVLAVLLAGLATGVARYVGVEKQSRRMRSAFTHYLSPDLVAALASDPGRLKLGGETRTMSFLFTDLEGFTSLTETRGAEALVHLLNDYLDGLCRIAMDHGGTVDKIVGDAVHVMFNAPLDQPDHAARAVAAALEMDRFAEAFRAGQCEASVAFGRTRIGVNTGEAVVGNFGGTRRFDYTAHGDAVNTAARLESANKALGTRICVARETVDRVPGQAFRPVATLMLKGKAVGIDVFEPTGAATPDLRDYHDAFARLARGDEGGARTIVGLSSASPDDPVLALHARRIAAGERSTSMAA